jgi:pimeloyl-ACP methyl ester carboxylesterase
MPQLTLILALLTALAVASWFAAPRWWARILLALARRRAGLVSRIIEIENIRWHFLEGGRGPTLLLLHGFGGRADNWDRLAPLLGPRFHLVIPDLPGFGESEPPDRLRFDIESQAERLSQFLDAVGIDRCLVAGNSMGGYLATALAAGEPDRVELLWLLAPLGVRSVEPGEMLRAIDSGDTEYLQISSLRQFRERFIPMMFSSNTWFPGPLVKAMADSAMAVRDQAPRMLQEVRFESEPLEAIAKRVSRPVLVQWGEDDRVVNPAGGSVLRRVFADAECVQTERCGHLPMWERPRESARCFFEFLDAHRQP